MQRRVLTTAPVSAMACCRRAEPGLFVHRAFGFLLALATFAVFSVSAVAQRIEQGYSDIENKTIDIYWTDGVPEIDGKGDDSCWAEAAMARAFTLVRAGGARPTQQTEVRICYDARALYVLWRLDEADAVNMKPGPAPDMRDVIEDSEKVFVQLDPGCTRRHWYEFTANPSGAWADRSKVAGWQYNPNWQVATGRSDAEWTVEMAIPWPELVHPGEWRATPQFGDCWGINFSRVRAAGMEQSQWSRTFGFHFYGHYGRATFRGRRQGKQVPTVKRLDNAPLYLGPGAILLQAEGVGDLTVVGSLIRDGNAPPAGQAEAHGSFVMLPYHLVDGGEWTANVVLSTDGRPVYTMREMADLPRLREQVAAIEESIAVGKRLLADADLPAKEQLTADLTTLEREMSNPSRWLRRAESLSRADWRLAVEQSGACQELWLKHRFDLALLRLFPGGSPTPAFGVATVGPDAKIHPDELIEGPLGKPIHLRGAGNEHESCQLVLVPFWRKLKNVRIGFTDLAGPDGATIPAANLRWFRIDYVHQMADNPYVARAHEREPDILRAAAAIDVEAGKLQPVWIDVFIPPGTLVGSYSGEVSVSAAGQTVVVPITVTSYGFDISKHPSIVQNHWLSFRYWREFYGTRVDEHGLRHQRHKLTPELFAQYCETLAEYRVQCWPMDPLTTRIRIDHDPAAGWSFDFSALTPYIEIGKRYGTNALWANFSCNLGGMMTRFASKHSGQPWIIDKRSGKRTCLADCIPNWVKKHWAGEVTLESNPAFIAFLQAYQAYLKEHGILDMAYWETFDEPYSATSRWLHMIDHHQVVDRHAPGLCRFAYGANPLQVYGGKSAVGVMDAWAPHLFECADTALVEACRQRQREHGEEFWFYTCTERQSPATGNFSPHTFYNRTYLAPRIIPWMAWDLQVDGFLVYSLSHVSEKEREKSQDQRYPAGEWAAGRMRGNGTLVYPGPDLALLPSMRLAALRDGMEDYEYFVVLRQALARLGDGAPADLAERVRAELSIEPAIIESPHDWTHDRAMLEAKRGRLAQLIRECSGHGVKP